ncbi:11084_t:CDS:1 [Cetraspora pellucida]|uniref:11084_t:CDS:1 n=1 Tax=Cetraspora pellucida TaxID=1433469 RepID=A0ACA9PC99_9GLOM|nr:11084_t:CDS:1 [Cetraspora pellucida]
MSTSNVAISNTKQCTCCNKFKPISEFTRQSENKSKIFQRCNICADHEKQNKRDKQLKPKLSSNDNSSSLSLSHKEPSSLSLGHENIPILSSSHENILSHSFSYKDMPSLSLSYENTPSLTLHSDDTSSFFLSHKDTPFFFSNQEFFLSSHKDMFPLSHEDESSSSVNRIMSFNSDSIESNKDEIIHNIYDFEELVALKFRVEEVEDHVKFTTIVKIEDKLVNKENLCLEFNKYVEDKKFHTMIKSLFIPLQAGSSYYWELRNLYNNKKNGQYTGCATAHIGCKQRTDCQNKHQDKPSVKQINKA